MAKQQQFVTPRGKAMWTKVNSRFDDWEGKKKYMVDLALDNPDEFLKSLKAFFESEKKTNEKLVGKKLNPKKESFGIKETSDGKIHFQFWTYAFGIDKKSQEEYQKTVPIFDNLGNRMDNTEIGNGSIIQIAYTPVAFLHATGNNGVFLTLNQIVVRELVEYNGSETPAFQFDEFTPSTEVDEEVPV